MDEETEFNSYESIETPEGWDNETILNLANEYQISEENLNKLVEAIPASEGFEPSKHEDFFEGDESEVSKEFVDLINKFKISPEASKEILKYQTKLNDGFVEDTNTEINEQLESWAEASASDKILNSGAGYEANVNSMNVVISQFGGEQTTEESNEFLDFLEDTGVAHHPEMQKFLFRISKQLAKEGRPSLGTTRVAKQAPLHDRLFAKNA